MNRNNLEKTKKDGGTPPNDDNMNAIANDAESKVAEQGNNDTTNFTDFTDKKNTGSLTNSDVINVAIMNEDPESKTE